MNTDKTERAFFHYARSWYAAPGNLQHDAIDLVTFGELGRDGSGTGELHMVWYEQGPRLEVFHDGWFALAGMSDLISTLGNLNGDPRSPTVFCELLTALGFADRTHTERHSELMQEPTIGR
jgi:hypothetical protein